MCILALLAGPIPRTRYRLNQQYQIYDQGFIHSRSVEGEFSGLPRTVSLADLWLNTDRYYKKSRRFSIKPAALHQLLKGVTELSALSHPTGCYPYHCHHPVPQSVQICIRCQSLRHLHTLHAAFHHHPIHQHPACRGWI